MPSSAAPPRNLLAELDGIEHLPALPVVAKQAMALIGSSHSNMAQIAHVISRDQAIAARVIRLVNSAFYGLRSKVASIQHAIVVLGLNTVKNLVMGVSVIKVFEDSAKASIFDREQFWAHTFAVARGARLLAEKTGRCDPEDYFVAGLLHDIGILALDQFFHSTFVEVLDASLRGRVPYRIAEERCLGVSHGAIGAALARRWGMPERIANTMAFHHGLAALPPDASVDRDHVGLVHVADAGASARQLASFAQGFDADVDQMTMRSLGLGADLVEEVFAQVRQEIRDLLREWGL